MLIISFSVQHYTELPDIKRVIVNTHAIEPQVFFLTYCSYLFYGLQLYYTSLILARYLVIAVTCRIFRYSLKGMGIRVHERLITSQSKGQFTDYCAGIIKSLSFMIWSLLIIEN